MTSKRENTKLIWLLTPLFGSLLFILLYIIATILYPGGSQENKDSKGFSWINNYWCNLLNESANNGGHNPARPFAMTAMFILCFTLAFFWYQFPRYSNLNRISRLAVQLSGTIAMAVSMFLFTAAHDIIINVSGLFGLIALAGTFVALYQNRWYRLVWFGAFNMALIGLNNFLYYTDGMLIYLPVVQKFSFLTFLVWICLIDIEIYRKAIYKT